jgi:hypothetical protein
MLCALLSLPQLLNNEAPSPHSLPMHGTALSKMDEECESDDPVEFLEHDRGGLSELYFHDSVQSPAFLFDTSFSWTRDLQQKTARAKKSRKTHFRNSLMT